MFNPYTNLTNYIAFEIKKIFNLEVTAKIKTTKKFKTPNNWIYLHKFFPVGIADNATNSDDSKYKIIALLLNIPGFFSSNWKLLLNKPKCKLNRAFIIGIYTKEHLNEIFSFQLAINTKYLNCISHIKNNKI